MDLLIRRVLAVPEFRDHYRELMKEFLRDHFQRDPQGAADKLLWVTPRLRIKRFSLHLVRGVGAHPEDGGGDDGAGA
jgi:hypothetical protein